MNSKQLSSADHLPKIAPTGSPSIFYDRKLITISYDADSSDGGGVAILDFSGVIDFRVMSVSAEELNIYLPEALPLQTSDVKNKNSRWSFYGLETWALSFNELTLIIVFESCYLRKMEGSVSDSRGCLLKHLSPPPG